MSTRERWFEFFPRWPSDVDPFDTSGSIMSKIIELGDAQRLDLILTMDYPPEQRSLLPEVGVDVSRDLTEWQRLAAPSAPAPGQAREWHDVSDWRYVRASAHGVSDLVPPPDLIGYLDATVGEAG